MRARRGQNERPRQSRLRPRPSPLGCSITGGERRAAPGGIHRRVTGRRAARDAAKPHFTVMKRVNRAPGQAERVGTAPARATRRGSGQGCEHRERPGSQQQARNARSSSSSSAPNRCRAELQRSRGSRSSPGSRAPPAAARADPPLPARSRHPARERGAQQMHLSTSQRRTGDLTDGQQKTSKVDGEARECNENS